MISASLFPNKKISPLRTMSSYFFAGTDTKVGKTHVLCALLRDLRRRGYAAAGFKPVACGDRAEARAMREAMGSSDGLEIINPLYFRACADPCMSAELERRSISADEVVAAYRKTAAEYEHVLVEGCGGWLTPIAPGVTMADVAAKLQLPVVLVVGNRPGAVNHTLLTLQDMQSRGLTCCGIILNHLTDDWDSATLTNRRLIEEFTGLPILEELIHGQDELDSSILKW